MAFLMMPKYFVLSVTIIYITLLLCVNCQHSSCPGVFDYVNDGYEVSGIITIQPKGPVSFAYFGSLKPILPIDYKKRLKRKEPIKYRIDFPSITHITSIEVNKHVICFDPPVSELSLNIILEHVLLINPGSAPFATDIVVPHQQNVVSGEAPYYSVAQNRNGVDFEKWNPITYKSLSMAPYSYITKTSQPALLTLNTPECGIVSAKPPIAAAEEYFRGKWPWLVALYKIKYNKLEHICSGTLISEWHVIAAAHCVDSPISTLNASNLLVKVGAHDLNDVTDDNTRNIYVDKAIFHDEYNVHTLKNDLVILSLQKKVIFNDFNKPICLESETDVDTIAGRRGIVTGWKVDEGTPHEIKVPIISSADCIRSNIELLKFTSDKTVCVGDKNGNTPCAGVSGLYLNQPADNRWSLGGVASIGLPNDDDDAEDNCNRNEYVVFTDLSKYLSWIRSVIAKKI